jgi:hypothetical protein
MTPTYIDFVYFCLFTGTIAWLFRKFCHGSPVSTADREKMLGVLGKYSQFFWGILTVGWLTAIWTSFYNGFILYITHKSFFKVVAFFISQFNF